MKLSIEVRVDPYESELILERAILGDFIVRTGLLFAIEESIRRLLADELERPCEAVEAMIGRAVALEGKS